LLFDSAVFVVGFQPLPLGGYFLLANQSTIAGLVLGCESRRFRRDPGMHSSAAWLPPARAFKKPNGRTGSCLLLAPQTLLLLCSLSVAVPVAGCALLYAVVERPLIRCSRRVSSRLAAASWERS
jgi:hypothetical protein